MSRTLSQREWEYRSPWMLKLWRLTQRAMRWPVWRLLRGRSFVCDAYLNWWQGCPEYNGFWKFIDALRANECREDSKRVGYCWCGKFQNGSHEYFIVEETEAK